MVSNSYIAAVLRDHEIRPSADSSQEWRQRPANRDTRAVEGVNQFFSLVL